jgi:hypothetical protein
MKFIYTDDYFKCEKLYMKIFTHITVKIDPNDWECSKACTEASMGLVFISSTRSQPPSKTPMTVYVEDSGRTFTTHELKLSSIYCLDRITIEGYNITIPWEHVVVKE